MNSGWVDAIQQRRRALMQRLGMAAASAMVFSSIVGWSFLAPWLVAYVLIQGLDVWLFKPITDGKARSLGPLRATAACIVLFVNAAIFGALSIPLWTQGGMAGGVCAGLLLAGGAIYSVINAPGSRVILGFTVAPQILYLGLSPVFLALQGAGSDVYSACAVAVVVFSFYVLNTWTRLDMASRAEGEARVEADRKRAESERISAERSAFLAAVGHDLRTPIGAILTGAAEVDRGANEAMTRANAALITDAGLMMKALLDDLLDHSKLEAGRMTVDDADFDLRGMVSQTVRLWRGPAKAKDLKLRITGVRALPAMARGDAMRLRQVLNNLLSNALKFTVEGRIVLTFRAWREEPTGHAIIIEVRDTGPGMTRSQLSRLFTPFDQTADGVGARHGGTGLGLTISRDLIGLMGGRLTARSRPGEGAAFTVSLTLAEALTDRIPVAETIGDDRGQVVRALATGIRPAAAPAQAQVSVQDPVPAPEPVVPQPTPEPAVAEAPVDEPEADEDRPLRVLVVDDHDINRRAVELILSPLGCDIATAADGLAALALCEVQPFDVIFMDVRMPELDGRETTKRIRAGNGPNALAPVISVTADTSPDDIAACMAAGMSYFVSKPLTPPALLGALQHVLSGDGEEEAAAA